MNRKLAAFIYASITATALGLPRLDAQTVTSDADAYLAIALNLGICHETGFCAFLLPTGVFMFCEHGHSFK